MASVETLSQLTAYRADLLSRARQEQAAASEVNETNRTIPQQTDLDPDLEPGVVPKDEIKGQVLDCYA